MKQVKTDICVIGAGSAGLSVAAGAAQLGAKVVLIEAGEMGGDCLNRGCVPSKALIAAAGHAQSRRIGAQFGIAPTEPKVDFAQVMDHVRQTIATIAPHDSQKRFEDLGVQVIRARARFVSEEEVEAQGTRIKARRFVVATGSRPVAPRIEGLDAVEYLTNESLFDLTDLPEHLVVLGGGPIGIEMAQAFRRLGSRVSVVEAGTIMGREDPDLVEVVRAQLKSEGVELHENASVQRVRAGEDDHAVTLDLGEGSVSGTHLLVATGRAPVTDTLDLEKARVLATRDGIHVTDEMRTTNRRVYAIGDVAGQGQFTHLAGYHASQIVRRILFSVPAKVRPNIVPRVTYTAPELAYIGLTEAQCREEYGGNFQVTTLPLARNDRAIATRQTDGMVKVLTSMGKPVGVGIVGPGAGDLIATWALAMAKGMKMSDIAGMVAAYPTLGETTKQAAGAYFSPRLFDNPTLKKAVGFVQRWLP
ncbi:MAG: FAD-dependent oxidoreductase [Celeribacter sp.]